MRNDWMLAACTLVVGACAQQPPTRPASGSAGTERGRIVAARVVAAPQAEQLQRIAGALAAQAIVGEAASPTGPVSLPGRVPGEMIEYIVRQEGGRTVSIVQAETTKLRAGETVLILPGLHPGERVQLLPDT